MYLGIHQSYSRVKNSPYSSVVLKNVRSSKPDTIRIAWVRAQSNCKERSPTALEQVAEIPMGDDLTLRSSEDGPSMEYICSQSLPCNDDLSSCLSIPMAPVSRQLKPGVYAPIPTFFIPTGVTIDLPSIVKHTLRLAAAGVWPLLAGSNGEAIHLSHEERHSIISSVRVALDAAGFEAIPIIAGTGAGSTLETIQLCQDAADAGADYAITIISGYFAGVLATHKRALKAFWRDVSEMSPIPVLMYNYPGASGGIDLDSDLVTELAEECPNLAGIKLTCGNVGKLTRICATVSQPDFAEQHPRKNSNAPFLVLGGFTDFLLPAIYANGHGVITGLGNVAPHAIVKLYELSVGSLGDPSLLAEAQRVQGIVARADYTIAKASVAGTKWLLEKLYGYGGEPRRPLPPIDPEDAAVLWQHPHTQELIVLERELGGQFV